MKKAILAIAASLLIAAPSFAQLKGDKFVGGSLGLSSNSTKVGSASSVSSGVSYKVGADFGYFVIDHLALEIGLGYGYNATSSKIGQGAFVINPGFEYFVPIADKVYYVPGFEFEIGFGSAKDEIGTYKFNAYTPKFAIFALEFRPTPHFGFNVGLINLGYSIIKYKDSSTKTKVYSYDLNWSPSVTARYYF